MLINFFVHSIEYYLPYLLGTYIDCVSKRVLNEYFIKIILKGLSADFCWKPGRK